MSTNLKILHVHDVASVGSTLVSGLREIGVDAELFTLSSNADTHLTKIIRSLRTIIFRIVDIIRLGQHLRKGKYNIVHIHFGTFAYLALLNRVPFYLHIHGTDIRRFVNSPVLGTIIRLGLQKANAVFYTTPDLKPLVEKYRPDAIFFPNPIDTEKFYPNKEPIDQQNSIVFNINKLDRYKGLDKVLPALDQILVNKPDVRVLMFDFGNALLESEEFISTYRKDPRLTLMHPVSHKKMLELIQGASVIVGQMETGSLGCSELESMACAKPVVCKFTHGDAYPSNPPLYNAHTSDELRERIEYILMNPQEAEKIGQDAHEWIVKYYDKKIVAKKLVEIYRAHSE